MMRGEEAKALAYENRIRHMIGYFSKSYALHAAQRKGSPLAEIGAFIKAVLCQKRMPQRQDVQERKDL
jgi:hypothetical protein